MSNLAIKYRPSNFEEMLGNNHIKEFFKKHFKDIDKMPKTFMFTGGSGNGKTTTARIIANELNISDMMLFEYNIANITGVDGAREIIEEASTPSILGGYKMFILDEVHMATANFQNCMLPILEHPPKNTIFCLCTTDPQKIIKTIKTRSTTFEVENPTNRQLGPFLTTIFSKEGVEVPKDVVKEIIKKSDNSIRKSLTISNKIISLPVEEMIASLEETATQEESAKKLIKALEDASSWNIVSTLLKGIKKGEEEGFRQYALACYGGSLLKDGHERYSYLIDKFSYNYFESGKAGLINTCFEISKGK